MPPHAQAPLVAIACGGTGGHLFPGVAVARALQRRGADVVAFISRKPVDQQASSQVAHLDWVSLDASTGFHPLRPWAFVRGLRSSWRTAAARFGVRQPEAVLSMGGFTGVGPWLAGRRCGARLFLHESNAVPGRANRWFAPQAARVFLGFETAARRLRCPRVEVTGTPVRPEFIPRDAAACRRMLGLDPARPVLLVVGGSQGASGLNEMVLGALPGLIRAFPDLQFIHLTGTRDYAVVEEVYRESHLGAVVRPSAAEMPELLGAATLALSRAGASSLAESAAVQLPSILVPYPAAADQHQFYNAAEHVAAGAALLLEQRYGTPERVVETIGLVLADPQRRERMKRALATLHRADAADRIAGALLQGVEVRAGGATARAAAHPGASERPSFRSELRVAAKSGAKF